MSFGFEATCILHMVKTRFNMVIIVSSVQDDFAYFDNLAYLRNGVENGHINFQGFVDSYAPTAFALR